MPSASLPEEDVRDLLSLIYERKQELAEGERDWDETYLERLDSIEQALRKMMRVSKG